MSKREEARKIISEMMCVPLAEVTDEKRLAEDLGADSLDKVETVMELETDLDVIVPDEVGEGWQTVGDVLDGIDRLLTV